MFSTLEINSLSHDLDSTVGMKFLKYFFLLPLALSVATLFMGCKSDDADGDDGNGIVVDVLEPGDTAARTVLVYMMAENNLSYFAGLDLAEMNRKSSAALKNKVDQAQLDRLNAEIAAMNKLYTDVTATFTVKVYN